MPYVRRLLPSAKKRGKNKISVDVSSPGKSSLTGGQAFNSFKDQK